MRSLATRLAALEEHFAVHGCTCAPLTVLHQQFDAPLSEEEIRSRLPNDCAVHRGEPAGLTVIINQFGAAHG